MAVTAGWFGPALQGQWSATAARRQDWVTGDPVKCVLTTVTWTIDNDAHDFYNDVTNELTTTGGYTAGGATLGTKALNLVGASNRIELDAADVSWTSASFTARKSAVYYDTAGASTTDPLFIWIDFGADQTVSAGTFTIQWDATGLATLTYT